MNFNPEEISFLDKSNILKLLNFSMFVRKSDVNLQFRKYNSSKYFNFNICSHNSSVILKEDKFLIACYICHE